MTITEIQSTKDRILASAMQLLDAGGADAVTLRAVGGAIGFSQSTPYRYYEDKHALLEAMVRANLVYLTQALEKAEDEALTPHEALNRVVRIYFDFARRFPARYRFLLESGRENSPLGAEVRQAFRAVAKLVQAAQQTGEVKGGDSRQIMALILGAAYGTAAYGTTELSAAARERFNPGPAPNLAPLLLSLLTNPQPRAA
jgi:AcrR family transcriptional regulator